MPLSSSFNATRIWAAINWKTMKMFQIFLMILFWNLSLLLRQWDIMEKTRYMSKMVSYNHNGMKTMNQDHLTLLSSLRASKIRNIKQMNHVKSALCRTAIVGLSSVLSSLIVYFEKIFWLHISVVVVLWCFFWIHNSEYWYRHNFHCCSITIQRVHYILDSWDLLWELCLGGRAGLEFLPSLSNLAEQADCSVPCSEYK